MALGFERDAGAAAGARRSAHGGRGNLHESPAAEGFSAPAQTGGLAYPVGFAAAERDPEIVLFLGLVLGRDLNRQSPEMSVPGLLALGLEASRNQWLRGCSPRGLALGWTQSLHALKSGAGHETAAFARPP